MRILIGASVFSAAGSLPLQVLPFLVLTLVAERRFDVAFAGWVGAAFLIGMLSSALLLPALRVARLRLWHGLCAIGAIMIAMALSVQTSVAPVFLLLWLVVGSACGTLQFLGATTAAAAINKPQAFALRLAVILMVASGVIMSLAQWGSAGSYKTLACFLTIAFGLAGCVGLVLYRKLPVFQCLRVETAPDPARRSWSGLVVVFAFFMGQPGFWAYAVHSASQRGLDLKDAAFVIAASKIISALVLLYSSRSISTAAGIAGLLGLGFAVATGIVVMNHSGGVIVFFAGFLMWELALNVLSARLQGMVVVASPGHAGVWITGAILLGSAAGPIAHGAAIGGGVGWAFPLYAALSGLFPFLWAWWKGRTA